MVDADVDALKLLVDDILEDAVALLVLVNVDTCVVDAVTDWDVVTVVEPVDVIEFVAVDVTVILSDVLAVLE